MIKVEGLAKEGLLNITSDEKNLVVQDSKLVMASYTLSLEEKRLILACIAKAQDSKAHLNSNIVEVSVNVNEYAALYNCQPKHAYKVLKQSSDKLFERVIVMDNEGVQTKARWLQEQAIYGSGKIKLTFSNLVSKHISEVVNEPSAYRLAQATQLRTFNAMRFFEFLNSRINPETQQGFWVVSIDELREKLELGDIYPRWVDFKKHIIQDSMHQINKNTSLKVDWEVAGKNGKRISVVKFSVFESDQLELSLF